MERTLWLGTQSLFLSLKNLLTALEEMGIAHDNKPSEATKWAPAGMTYGRERR